MKNALSERVDTTPAPEGEGWGGAPNEGWGGAPNEDWGEVFSF